MCKWLLYFKAPCKRKGKIGFYTLRPFAHSVACFCVSLGVVAQTLKLVKVLAMCKRTHQLPTILIVVGQQCCVSLHQA